ncbi:Transposon Ty3-I Gag-Pol polyprotein [Pelomyxa schiedti]|nr:Transposon Ty3-I Gag-Pol polyprotein [Pelomyxa schiedti]
MTDVHPPEYILQEYSVPKESAKPFMHWIFSFELCLASALLSFYLLRYETNFVQRILVHPITPESLLTLYFNPPCGTTIAFDYFRNIQSSVIHKIDRFHLASPLHDQSAATVVKAIEKIWITKQGCPRQLRSDRGTDFVAKVNAEFCRTWKIKQDVVTAWHPESNGAAENAVKTLKASLEKYCTGRASDWDTSLHWIEMDINTTVSALTNETPFFVDHGREANLPIDFETGANLTEDNSYLRQLLQQRQGVREVIREKQAHEKERQHLAMKRRVTKLAKAMDVGTKVMLKASPNQLKAGLPKWNGPYRIIKVPTQLTRVLDFGPSQMEETVHVARLKLYVEGQRREVVSQPIVYKQEQVLMHRVTRHGEEFKVKFQGHARSEAQWMQRDEVDKEVLEVWERKDHSQRQRRQKAPALPISQRDPKRGRPCKQSNIPSQTSTENTATTTSDPNTNNPPSGADCSTSIRT